MLLEDLEKPGTEPGLQRQSLRQGLQRLLGMTTAETELMTEVYKMTRFTADSFKPVLSPVALCGHLAVSSFSFGEQLEERDPDLLHEDAIPQSSLPRQAAKQRQFRRAWALWHGRKVIWMSPTLHLQESQSFQRNPKSQLCETYFQRPSATAARITVLLL